MPTSNRRPHWSAGRVATYCWLIWTMLAWSTPAGSAIYRWEDGNGITHYSDRPVAQARRIEVDPGHAWHRVARIHDGDTLQLEDGRKIRLLGINTPEIESRHRDGEPGGEAARKWLAEQIGSGRIRLEWDRQKQDHYGRWLAHLFTEQQLHLNLELVRAGLATVSLIPPNDRYTSELLEAQQQAERQRRGIWGMPAYQPRSAAQATATPRRGWQRIRARPVAILPGRSYMRLQLTDNLAVRIPKASLAYFPPLEDYLQRRVEVRGWVSRRKESFSILVRHPSALVVLD